ncbi:MAG: helix-turn-helix transcriptional regulator [Roseivirga sp.]|nr:helix-turn-helix transcriptional regulator [Roseivirga sp.]
MVPIEIARLIGLLLGPVTGILMFIIWRNYQRSGSISLHERRTLLLLTALAFTVAASFWVEYNRAPIVKKLSYRMERPKTEANQNIEPITQRIRMTERGSTLSVLGPVLERQIIGALLSFLLLFVLYRQSLKKKGELLSPIPTVTTLKPLTIDIHVTLDRLNKLLDEEKIYTNPGLQLEDLSGKLGISRYQLSQLINEELGQNFYELINEKRVEAAIRAMNSGDHAEMTLSALGFEVGFNSKSSFYRAFKKKTGKTPAAFRKELS